MKRRSIKMMLSLFAILVSGIVTFETEASGANRSNPKDIDGPWLFTSLSKFSSQQSIRVFKSSGRQVFVIAGYRKDEAGIWVEQEAVYPVEGGRTGRTLGFDDASWIISKNGRKMKEYFHDEETGDPIHFANGRRVSGVDDIPDWLKRKLGVPAAPESSSGRVPAREGVSDRNDTSILGTWILENTTGVMGNPPASASMIVRVVDFHHKPLGAPDSASISWYGKRLAGAPVLINDYVSTSKSESRRDANSRLGLRIGRTIFRLVPTPARTFYVFVPSEDGRALHYYIFSEEDFTRVTGQSFTRIDATLLQAEVMEPFLWHKGRRPSSTKELPEKMSHMIPGDRTSPELSWESFINPPAPFVGYPFDAPSGDGAKEGTRPIQ